MAFIFGRKADDEQQKSIVSVIYDIDTREVIDYRFDPLVARAEAKKMRGKRGVYVKEIEVILHGVTPVDLPETV